MTGRTDQLLLILVFALTVTACGATNQYMIPRGADGAPIIQPKSKLRLSACANCYMWTGHADSPRGFLPLTENSGIVVDILSPYRCFLWLFVIPLPLWGSCSPTVEVPESHVISLRLSNQSQSPARLAPKPVVILKSGEEVARLVLDGAPTVLDPGEEAAFRLDLGDWSSIGWGYELDLSGPLGFDAAPISIERFTTTTFGFMLLD